MINPCEKHHGIFISECCPICLIEERDKLAEERDRLVEWVARLETENGKLRAVLGTMRTGHHRRISLD